MMQLVRFLMALLGHGIFYAICLTLYVAYATY